MASTGKILSDLLNEVVALRKDITELKQAKTSMASGPAKARKAKDPDAPKKAPNSWILFTGEVRRVLKEASLPAGKEAQQFASHLKTTFPEAYKDGSLTEEAILAEYPNWTPPPPKPKEEKEEEAEAKPKPKRVLSDEQKAKMAEGRRKAAAARKAAETAAKEAEEEEEEADEAKPPTPKAVTPPKAPKALQTIPYKANRCLFDPETKGLWKRNADGTKGDWMGVLQEKMVDGKKTRVLDDSVEEPEEE